jgi:hypothetical protein
MVARFGDAYVGVLDGPKKPADQADGRRVRANHRVISMPVTLAGQAAGDTILIARRPAGSVFLGVTLNSSVSLGAAQVAIGVAGNTSKYKDAGTFTTPDTPTNFAKAAAVAAAPITDREDIIITVSAAALPVGGTLVANVHYAAIG